MLIARPVDIASYIYCPILYKNKKQYIVKPLTFFESCIRAALIEGERQALLRDTEVTPRMLLKAWDKIWWPAVIKKKISMAEADKYTLKATEILTSYSNYDLASYIYPTAGVLIGARLSVGRYTIEATTDLLKISLATKDKNTILVNFTNRDLDIHESALDPIIKCISYMFYYGNNESVSHVNVFIDARNNRVKTTMSRFDTEDMEEIRKMLYHVVHGISSKTFYPNVFMCKGCGRCKNLE